jgi:hypothetical protein
VSSRGRRRLVRSCTPGVTAPAASPTRRSNSSRARRFKRCAAMTGRGLRARRGNGLSVSSLTFGTVARSATRGGCSFARRRSCTSGRALKRFDRPAPSRRSAAPLAPLRLRTVLALPPARREHIDFRERVVVARRRRRCRLVIDRPTARPPLWPASRKQPRRSAPVRRCRRRDDCDEPHFVGCSLDGRFKLGEQRRRRLDGRPASRTTSTVVRGLPASGTAVTPVGSRRRRKLTVARLATARLDGNGHRRRLRQAHR